MRHGRNSSAAAEAVRSFDSPSAVMDEGGDGVREGLSSFTSATGGRRYKYAGRGV